MRNILIFFFTWFCLGILFTSFGQNQLVPDPGFENTPMGFLTYNPNLHWTCGMFDNWPTAGFYPGGQDEDEIGKPLIFNVNGFCAQKAIAFDPEYSAYNASCYPGPAGLPVGFNPDQCFSNKHNIWGSILPGTTGHFAVTNFSKNYMVYCHFEKDWS